MEPMTYSMWVLWDKESTKKVLNLGLYRLNLKEHKDLSLIYTYTKSDGTEVFFVLGVNCFNTEKEADAKYVEMLKLRREELDRIIQENLSEVNVINSEINQYES